MRNKLITVNQRPYGRIKSADLALLEVNLDELTSGMVRIKVLYLSVEPAMRGWMINRADYMPPLALGDMLHGFAVGKVVESKHLDFTLGQIVTGNLGAQELADIDPDKQLLQVFEHQDVNPSLAMGLLGITGLTAYFGINKIANLKRGETFVVSAAAGAVGSVAGQLALLAGCRVIGIVGSDEKVDWLQQELGFNGAVNYKSDDVAEQLKDLCPDGIDVYFDNVGAEVLDVCLSQIKDAARIVLCGGIANYNATKKPAGPANYFALVHRRALMQGYIVLDYVDEFPQAISWMKQHYLQGNLSNREYKLTGIEKLPQGLAAIFDGTNLGKVLIEM
ncbi:MAG: NADPH-dependent curcumin reductase CurA [Shewanella sp.]|jgi:NADPH-dependent curcumin reductase CurA